jgi:hypothetical protein
MPENQLQTDIIKNESIYAYMKCQSNQSLFTQLTLHFLTVIFVFTIFSPNVFMAWYLIKQETFYGGT